MAYMEASIASCPPRDGWGCSGGSQAPIRGFIGLRLLRFCPYTVSDLWLFTQVYFYYVIDFIGIASIYTLLLRDCGTAVRHCRRASTRSKAVAEREK